MGKSISIWTDGSSHNNGKYKGIGGWGAVLIFGELPEDEEKLFSKYADDKSTLEIYGSSNDTTNQQMEIKAITEALKRLKKANYQIHIFSDSAYVVNCMNEKWWHNWKSNGWINSQKKPVANREFWEELLQVIEDNFLNVTFHKAKGHSNIYYNELADKLAGRGTQEAKLKMGDGR